MLDFSISLDRISKQAKRRVWQANPLNSGNQIAPFSFFPRMTQVARGIFSAQKAARRSLARRLGISQDSGQISKIH